MYYYDKLTGNVVIMYYCVVWIGNRGNIMYKGRYDRCFVEYIFEHINHCSYQSSIRLY